MTANMSYLALQTDHEARYVYVSPQLGELLGVDPAAMVGQAIEAVHLPDDLSPQWSRTCHQVLETGTPTDVGCAVHTPDGVAYWQFAFYPVFESDLPYAVSVIAREMPADSEATGHASRVAHEYLCDVLEHARDLIYRLNLRTGTYDYASQSAEAITGFSSAALQQMDMQGFCARIHPADRGRFLEHTEALITGCRDMDEVIEYRFCHANGEYHWVSDSRTVVRDGRGVALALAGSLRDVTQQQRARNRQAGLLEELVASRERLEQVVQQMPIGVTIADATTGNLIMVNEEARRILGSSLGDMAAGRGGALQGARHPDGRPFAAEEYPQARSLRDGEVVKAEEVYWRRSDDTELVLAVTSAPIRDYDSSTIATVSTFIDITEKRRSEAALWDGERRFRAAIDSFPGILAIYDADQRIQFINQTGVRLCGRPEDEVLGRRDGEVFPPEVSAQYTHLLARALAAGLEQRSEQTLPEAMGGRTFMREFIPLPGGNGHRGQVLSVAYDISERREVERQLEELNASLERRVIDRTAQLRALAAELVDVEQRERRRLAQLLHDHIQQLLVAARINTSVLLKEVSDDALRQPLEQVDRLLDQSIQTSRSLTVELSPPVLYDLGLPAALHWLARSMQEGHGLTVEVEAEDDADPQVDSLRAMLFQATRELLFNVVKHAGVRAAKVRLYRQDGCVRVCVSDEGAGFDAGQVCSPAACSGFGLFSIRERLDSLGGGLAIESAPGKGTRICLSVVLAPATPTGSTAVESAQNDSPTAGDHAGDATGGERERIRVLLADDHAILRKGLTRMLQSESDMEIVGEAVDGREAVELAHSLVPDVVLMDVSMPRMDGIEATRRIRSELPTINVIGLSMHDEADVSARMRHAGACGYVSKSGDTAALLAAIRGCRPAPQSCAPYAHDTLN